MATVAEDVIKVLVVDDSAFIRRVVKNILEEGDSGIEVVDTARNGVEALEKAMRLKPQVIILDIEMPEMDGLTCLKKLLEKSFVPVIMFSAFTKEGAENTIKALETGAVDFVAKPTGVFDISKEDKRKELLEKVRMAARASGPRVSSEPFRKARSGKKADKPVLTEEAELKHIVAIGVSTGGPRALQYVIPHLPAGIPAALLVVQHMPSGFTKSLAERLNYLSELAVKEAEDGERLKAGHVYIAPGDYHMKVAKGDKSGYIIKLTKEPPVRGHRPSVDVMMESLSSVRDVGVTGVIMTGMGNDGSRGIKVLKKRLKSRIIVQDEESCVVFGMPRSAIETGAVDSVVPLKDIPKEVLRSMGVLIQ